jgi:hypothetical protein
MENCMADRFKDDKTKQDYTFYSINKKTDKKINMTKFMYCNKCASEPIIAVDNAKEYICIKCLKQMLADKWNIRNRKVELFKKLISEIDISKYNQKEYEKIVNLIFQDIFRLNDG